MMEFTGERLVPGKVNSCIHYEHLHRYVFAASLATGRRVLDLGSGEGYGAALLARTAESVVGVDISQEAVAHACVTYGESNVRFVCADARRLTFAAGSFDLVVSFELIEHMAECEALLDEAARVLRPNGLLVISSPNKRFYHLHDQGQSENSFHVRELEQEELETLLAARFPKRRILAQNIALGSFIWPPEDGKAWSVTVTDGPREHPEREALRSRPDPIYTIAVCAKQADAMPAEIAAPSLLLDSNATVVRALESHVADMMRHMKAKDEHITDMMRHIEDKERRIKVQEALLDRLQRNPLAYIAHQARRGARFLARLVGKQPG